tara:strand:- start:2120 stop:2509 length:390 start_codon:yes stop_codon:yes gene_type:complete
LNTTHVFINDAQRKLCIKKDLIELSQWIEALENINTELDYLSAIDKQFLGNRSVSSNIQMIRRKNIGNMGSLCQYEQQLRKEFEYGKREYDVSRAKEHEKKRDQYSTIIIDFEQLKIIIYNNLLKYKPK